MQRKEFLKRAAVPIAMPFAHPVGFAQIVYPNKPITMVVGFAPGGMTDIVGRMLAAELSKVFGKGVIVDNKPGAAGQLATEYVARKPPDGYTLQLSAAGHVIAPATQKIVRYDPVNDFEAIAMVANAPIVLVLHPDLPVQSVPEFIRWAKLQASVPYGSAGVGGSSHLAGELFRHVTGTPLTHVAYRGGAPAISDLVAGQINVAFMDSVSVASFIRTGKVKLIAVAAKSRSGLFPDTPTIAEAGYNEVDTSSWLGLYAPAGTSMKDVALLNQHVNRVMHAPEMVDHLRQQNCEPGTSFLPAQMKTFVLDEVAKWKNIVRITGMKIE